MSELRRFQLKWNDHLQHNRNKSYIDMLVFHIAIQLEGFSIDIIIVVLHSFVKYFLQTVFVNDKFYLTDTYFVNISDAQNFVNFCFSFSDFFGSIRLSIKHMS